MWTVAGGIPSIIRIVLAVMHAKGGLLNFFPYIEVPMGPPRGLS